MVRFHRSGSPLREEVSRGKGKEERRGRREANESSVKICARKGGGLSSFVSSVDEEGGREKEREFLSVDFSRGTLIRLVSRLVSTPERKD